MPFIFDAALRFRLKLGLDVVEKLVEALGWANLGAPHDAGRIVVHGHNGEGSGGTRSEDGQSGSCALRNATVA